MMTKNKYVLAAPGATKRRFLQKRLRLQTSSSLVSSSHPVEFMSVAEIVRVFRSRKYLMVIERDYTAYYNHWPPVRVFPSDGMYPPSSPWKREAFHLVCIRYFLHSAADVKIQKPLDECVAAAGSWFSSLPVWWTAPPAESCAAKKKKGKVRLQRLARRIALVVIGVFVLRRINCASCLSRMHDNQRQPQWQSVND